MLTAVVGINWGDEGKGRMVDLLASEYDIICRYQGGNNAGHTVVNEKGHFILNLLPSGILRDDAVNVMGPGMVIDIEHLYREITGLKEKGIAITQDNLKISDKAFICFPYHKMQDILEEDRLADRKYGSTRRGISPCYGDKYMKKGLRMEDLADIATLEEKLRNILEWKNLQICGYQSEAFELAEMMQWIKEFGLPLAPHVMDTAGYLQTSANMGKHILFEGQLGALRDIEFGIYPFTTSSNTIAAYAPIGAGIPGIKTDHVMGIMKAYSSCVGEGPFAAEFFGEEAEQLRKHGAEFGAATGRPRRVGGFDVPASIYGVTVQGADELALTKLDVLSYMDRIPVCVAYEIDGERTTTFPSGDRHLRAKPVYEYLEGFQTDIKDCRTPSELPQKALDYIRYLEKAVQCPIKYVSVGPERGDYIEMR